MGTAASSADSLFCLTLHLTLCSHQERGSNPLKVTSLSEATPEPARTAVPSWGWKWTSAPKSEQLLNQNSASSLGKTP